MGDRSRKQRCDSHEAGYPSRAEQRVTRRTLLQLTGALVGSGLLATRCGPANGGLAQPYSASVSIPAVGAMTVTLMDGTSCQVTIVVIVDSEVEYEALIDQLSEAEAVCRESLESLGPEAFCTDDTVEWEVLHALSTLTTSQGDRVYPSSCYIDYTCTVDPVRLPEVGELQAVLADGVDCRFYVLVDDPEELCPQRYFLERAAQAEAMCIGVAETHTSQPWREFLGRGDGRCSRRRLSGLTGLSRD